jgi:hypothetical protein
MEDSQITDTFDTPPQDFDPAFPVSILEVIPEVTFHLNLSQLIIIENLKLWQQSKSHLFSNSQNISI